MGGIVSSPVGVDLQNKKKVFVDNLISKMTLEEKIGQLNQYSSTWDITGPPPKEDESGLRLQQVAEGKVGSMLNILGTEATRQVQNIAVNESRLGIPLLFGYDLVHGYKTLFPIPLADAASWNPKLIQRTTEVAAKEASAAGVHWAYAPMMDVTREPRWGRIMEGAGEDPFLGAKVAEARVKGFQGKSLNDIDTVAATAKHFIGYGFVTSGLEYNTTEISTYTLYNISLPPFKAAIKAGVAGMMNSFNDVGGVPLTAHKKLQRNLLRNQLGFEGVLVSDWNTIGEMTIHKFSKDLKDAAKQAIIAGTDVDMESRGYDKHLLELIEEGEVDEALVDEAVTRILSLKYELGLFDDPFKYCDEEREKTAFLKPEYRALAREVAKSSIVLLRNESNILPLKKTGQKLAVIGALASDKDTPIGSWRGQVEPNSAISLLEGIKNATGNSNIVNFAQGYFLASGEREFTQELKFERLNDTSLFDEAIQLARNSDTVIVAVGEECFQSGEGRSQTDIHLKGKQLELLQEIKKVNKNMVVVLMNGRPIPEPWMYENIPAVLECWYLGTEAGSAIADVLFGDYNPSGKLPVSIPRSVGQVPVYYNHNRTGRPNLPEDPDFVFWSHFTDSPRSPQYAFGHGLSYTTFEYSTLKLSATSIKSDEILKVSVSVTNTGKIAGEEVIQLYLNDLYASCIRPVKELKGFQKVHFEAGETKTIEFELDWESLAFYNDDLEFAAEPGEFEVMVGGNSVDLLSTTFELK